MYSTTIHCYSHLSWIWRKSLSWACQNIFWWKKLENTCSWVVVKFERLVGVMKNCIPNALQLNFVLPLCRPGVTLTGIVWIIHSKVWLACSQPVAACNSSHFLKQAPSLNPSRTSCNPLVCWEPALFKQGPSVHLWPEDTNMRYYCVKSSWIIH